MSLAELLPSIHALPRSDKFRLMQTLIAELAHEESRSTGEYLAGSSHGAREVTANLLQLPEQARTDASGSRDVMPPNGDAGFIGKANTEMPHDSIMEQNEVDLNLIEVDGHLLFRYIDVVDWTSSYQPLSRDNTASCQ